LSKSEDAADLIKNPYGGLTHAALHNRLDHIGHHCRGDSAHRQATKSRKHVALQCALRLFVVDVAPPLLLLRQPLDCERLERLGSGGDRSCARKLPLLDRVAAFSDQCLRGIAFIPGVVQREGGERADGVGALLAVQPVLHTPDWRSGWRVGQVQPAAIGELALLRLLGLVVPEKSLNPCFAQLVDRVLARTPNHVQPPSFFSRHTPSDTPKFGRNRWMPKDTGALWRTPLAGGRSEAALW